MSDNDNNSTPAKSTYPIPISLTLIAAAIVLSFVDLMFLNDVIGKILDLGSGGSMLIAFALGMVGIFIMAHQGVKVAHGTEVKQHARWNYTLWVSLGLAFVLIRLFSASILLLDGTTDRESLVTILGLNVREVDLVLAPLMLFLYLATGLMVKDGVKHLLLNPELEDWRIERKESKEAIRLKEDNRRTQAEERTTKTQSQAEKNHERRAKELEETSKKQRETDKNKAIRSSLDGAYDNALSLYNAKLDEMKQKYQTISSNIDYVKTMDEQEYHYKHVVKPGLRAILQGSIDSVQNSVALAIRKKSGEDIADLSAVIDSHNKSQE